MMCEEIDIENELQTAMDEISQNECSMKQMLQLCECLLEQNQALV
jgi:hypothetical protein